MLAPHVAPQLVHLRRLRPADDVQRDRLMGAAAEAFDLEVQIASIQRIAQGGGGLSRALESQHALVPGLAGELIGLLASFVGPRSSEARTEAP